MIWTQEMKDFLERLWLEEPDLSASKIADAIGRRFHVYVSRNAVIGKAHRAGLAVKKKSTAHKRQHPRREPLPPPRLVIPQPVASSPLPPPRLVRHARPKFGKFSILDLDSGSCRWVTGGGLYCGKKIFKTVYCEEHAKESYVAVNPGLTRRKRGYYL
jgi:GcrA cell cycle regulator